MADSCSVCGTELLPEDALCPACGARIDSSSGPVDQLLLGLDDLTRTVDAELAGSPDAEALAAEEAIGQLEATQEVVGSPVTRGAADHADLKSFVQRVRVAAATRDLAGLATLPPRNPWAPPIIGLGALLAAWGVFQLASDPYIGALGLLGGAATTGIGSALYRLRPAAQ